VDAVSDDGSSSSHTSQAQDASSSSYELVPAPKKQKGPFGQALSRKKKNFIALDSSSGSSSSSSSSSSSVVLIWIPLTLLRRILSCPPNLFINPSARHISC